MSEWGYVTFVHSTDVDAIESALVRVFAAEGMRRASSAPPPRNLHPLQYASGRTARSWALAVGAGPAGWTIVRGTPAEVLGEPREDGGVPRLVALARELGAEAAHFALYDVTGVIVEAAPDGRWSLSGCTLDGLEYFGIPIPEERAELRFELITLPPSLLEALGKHALSDFYYLLLETLGGTTDWEYLGKALNGGEPLSIPDARLLRFERADPGPAAAAPLRVAYAKDEHGRLTLGADGGAMWIDGWFAHAPDAASGGRFLAALAAWLGVPVPPGEPGVPIPLFHSDDEGATSVRISFGDPHPGCLVVTPSPDGASATIEEDDPALRAHLIDLLTPMLRGARAKGRAVFETFEAYLTTPARHTRVAFAGEVPLVAAWDVSGTELLVDGARVASFPSRIAMGLAALRGGRVAALLADTGASYHGISQDDHAWVVSIEMATGQVSTLLESDADLKFAHANLIASPDGDSLALNVSRKQKECAALISADGHIRFAAGCPVGWDGAGPIVRAGSYGETRLGRPEGDIGFAPLETVVTPDGRFQVAIADDRAVAVIDGAERRPVDEELFAPYPLVVAFAGPGGLVVGGRTPYRLDLATGRQARLFGAKGLELGALSPSGEQVLAVTGNKTYVWHARRGTTSADVSRRRIRSGRGR